MAPEALDDGVGVAMVAPEQLDSGGTVWSKKRAQRFLGVCFGGAYREQRDDVGRHKGRTRALYNRRKGDGAVEDRGAWSQGGQHGKAKQWCHSEDQGSQGQELLGDGTRCGRGRCNGSSARVRGATRGRGVLERGEDVVASRGTAG